MGNNTISGLWKKMTSNQFVEHTRELASEMAKSVGWVVSGGYEPSQTEYQCGPGSNAHMFWKIACVAQIRLTGRDPDVALQHILKRPELDAAKGRSLQNVLR